ncbi:MAG TPA: hypothetical protein VFD84_08765 [Candidatus Binatia bacterium]|nr:hypothetical protein [Candidatus Binatia bacterium]
MPRLAGWPIVGVAAAFVAVLLAADVALLGTGEAAIRFALRATARTALVFFLAAFVASAAARTWPGARTRWLLANRRYLGVGFAVTHLAHAAAILAFAALLADEFRAEEPFVVLVAGGIGYLFVLALLATSFDRTAAWLGPRRWARLHTVGVHYLWAVFFVTYVPQAARGPVHAAAAALVVGALGLRLAARRRALPVSVGPTVGAA